MSHQARKGTAPAKPTVNELRAQLALKIARRAESPATECKTAFPGLSLFRHITPSPCYFASAEPSLSIFVQGKKRINVGGEIYLCDESSFLIYCIDVPIQSQIIEASEDAPCLSIRLQLDLPTVREVLSKEDLPRPRTASERRGLAVGMNTQPLLSAVSRMIDLLDTPEDIPFLGHLIEPEIIYRVLQTPQGERLRAIATTGNLSHRAAKAITWLSENYAKCQRRFKTEPFWPG